MRSFSRFVSPVARRFTSPSSLLTVATPAPLAVTRRFAHFDATIGLTEEQKEFQSVAFNFGQTEMLPFARDWDRDHHFPKDVLKKAAELGFAGIYVKPDVGGAGLGRMDAAVIFEAMAMSCVSTTSFLTIHNMCSWMIDTFGTPEQRLKWLPDLVKMDLFASYCLTEPGAGSDAGNLATTAKLVGDEYILNGSKAFISGGGSSDVYLVMARTGGEGSGPKGISCFIVPKSTPGLSFGKQEDKLGWNSQPTCAVIMEDARVPKANMLGKLNSGFAIAMKGLDGGRINIGTTSLGGAQACLNSAIDHVKIRKQFNAPLSSFQSIQFKLAELSINLQAARLMIHSAAHLLDAAGKDDTQREKATIAAAMAKKFATDTGFDVCNRSLQMFGGYGYLKDYPIERYLRDVRVHQILEGTNEVMQMIVARNILKD